MRTGEAVMSTISDETISDLVTAAASDAGVSLGDDAITVIVAAMRKGLRNAIDECEAEAGRGNEMRTMIRREVQRFMRAIGVRPSNGRYQTL